MRTEQSTSYHTTMMIAVRNALLDRRMSDGWASSVGASTSASGPPGASFARRLEDVLQDRSALDAFKAWMDSNASSHPLDLHFAIIAHATMCAQSNPQANELARKIYSRYISLRTGYCSFIPSRVRQEVGTRVKSLPPGQSDARVFDTVRPYLDGYLRRQHDEFVHSDEFVDLFNRTMAEDGGGCGVSGTSTSYGSGHTTRTERSSSTHGSKSRSSRHSGSSSGTTMIVRPHHPPSSSNHFAPPPLMTSSAHADLLPSTRQSGGPSLTAHTLMMSQRDREHTLGESALERMYAGGTASSTATPHLRQGHGQHYRNPYVCRATTSANDSAVSSTFSAPSEHSGTHHRGQPIRLSAIREEHLRANPKTFTIPKSEGIPIDGSKQYAHDTDDGRRKFMADLTRKLQRVVNARKRDDVTQKQLKELREQRGQARTLISTTEAPLEVQLDEEDDVEEYLERLRVDSSSGAPSAPRTPRAGAPGAHSPKPPPFPGSLHHPHTTPHHHHGHQHHSLPPSMTSSGTGAATFFQAPLTIRHGVNSFAPPPSATVGGHYSFAPPPGAGPTTPRVYAIDRSPSKDRANFSSPTYDSSGIESLAPSDETTSRRRSLPGSSHTPMAPPPPLLTPLHHTHHHSMERSRKDTVDQHHNIDQRLTEHYPHHRSHEQGRRKQSAQQLLTISYRGIDGVPVVAHVPTVDGSMTLKEFRRHFSIPSNAGVQFFFKTSCDDFDDDEDTVPDVEPINNQKYQLLLVKDDATVLPLFNGRVAAELKMVAID